jgi:hypothetical protein
MFVIAGLIRLLIEVFSLLKGAEEEEQKGRLFFNIHGTKIVRFEVRT